MTAGRPGISRRIRFDIFKRDAFTCQYCGKHPPEVILEIDHVVPVCEGGVTTEENLITACFECNRGKGGISLSVIPKSLEQKAAEIAEREAQIAGYRTIVQARTDRIEADAWEVAETLFPDCSDKGINRDWFRSITIFTERLALDEVIEAAALSRDRIYHDRHRFLYFCKICWAKIKGEAT